MFRWIARTEWWPSRHMLAILGLLAILGYLDARHLMVYGLSIQAGNFLIFHIGFVLIAIIFFVILYVDGSAPVRPGEEPFSNRQRAAFLVAGVLAIVVAACWIGAKIIEACWPVEIVEMSGVTGEGITWNVAVPHLGNWRSATAFVLVTAFKLTLFAALVLAIWAPACAAQFGARRAFRESVRALRRHWFTIGLYYLASLVLLFPIFLLSLPLQALWDAVMWDAPGIVRFDWILARHVALDFIEFFGANAIALGAAASAFLLGSYLWGVGRAASHLVEKQRG